MPINISLHGHSLLPQKELPRAARRTVVNVQLIKDIRVVKCPGAEQTENLVDEGTKLKKKNITSWRWSMMIGGIRGMTVREKTEVGSLMRLPPIFGAKKWALSACQAESQ